MDLARGDGNKRRPPRNEPEQTAKETPTATQTAPAAPSRQEAEIEDKPIPDDLSEISDDPDDILNREDVSYPVVKTHFLSQPFNSSNCHFVIRWLIKSWMKTAKLHYQMMKVYLSQKVLKRSQHRYEIFIK